MLDLKRQGRTVVLTTHYLEEAEILCDRLAIMDHGRILEAGTVKELVGRHFQERAVRFDAIDGLGDEALAGDRGRRLRWPTRTARSCCTRATSRPRSRASSVAADRVGVEPENLTIRRPTLEDVFLALTGRALRD